MNDNTIKPLPRLPIEQDLYVSQEQVDQLIDYMIETQPVYMRQVVDDDVGEKRGGFHYMAYCDVIYNAKKAAGDTQPFPETDLGLIDLAYELSRRIRKAYGAPEYLTVGQPLAPTPEGPYPDFPEIDVERAKQQEELDISDDEVIKTVKHFYRENGFTAYVVGESMRKDQLHIGPFFGLGYRFRLYLGLPDGPSMKNYYIATLFSATFSKEIKRLVNVKFSWED